MNISQSGHVTYTRLHGQEVANPYFIPRSMGPKIPDFATLHSDLLIVPNYPLNS